MSTDPERVELLASLARAARCGDRGAFERLVTETSPQIHALCLRLVGDEQDARDVAQETYLRAFRAIGRFRGDAAVSTWLYRIAANASANHLAREKRRHHRGREAELTFEPRASGAGPEEAAEALGDREVLLAALARLPQGLRHVVVLHDVYDLDHPSIAAELGISRTASKVRLHRARRRLHDLLEGPGDLTEGPSEGALVRLPEPVGLPRGGSGAL